MFIPSIAVAGVGNLFKNTLNLILLPWIVEYFLARGKRLSYMAGRETASVTRSRLVFIYL